MVRTVGKLLLVGTLAASFTACLDSTSVDDGTQSVDRENDALTIVVNDMRGLIPAEVVDEPNRVLGAQFQGASPPRAVPEAVREAAGLPVVDSLATPRTETYVVLNLFEPRYFEDDSVVVAAEWLVFDGTGDGGSFWGEDWVYVLTCDPTCVRLRRHGPGHMN